jgi:hypothetical protein
LLQTFAFAKTKSLFNEKNFKNQYQFWRNTLYYQPHSLNRTSRQTLSMLAFFSNSFMFQRAFLYHTLSLPCQKAKIRWFFFSSAFFLLNLLFEEDSLFCVVADDQLFILVAVKRSCGAFSHSID